MWLDLAGPKRRLKVRRQLQPDSVRLFYFSNLRALMARAHARVTDEVLPLVHETFKDDARRDAADDVKAKIREVAKAFARQVAPGPLRILTDKVAERTAAFQKVQLQNQLKDVLGVAPFFADAKLSAMSEAFTRENVALIKTVPERYFAELEQVVSNAVPSGARATTISKQIEERYSVSESNAARLANDQVGKFYGDLNRTRQRELGITGYEWATVHDGRVRDNHEQLDGTFHEWDDPPMGGGTDDREAGHPGSGINCRCNAIPDVRPLLGYPT